jgi:serine/threonine protein kinase
VKFDTEEWEPVSVEAKELIKSMLSVDVDERISIDEALDHKWFGKALGMYKSTISTMGSCLGHNSSSIAIE